jgi:cytochrome c556
MVCRNGKGGYMHTKMITAVSALALLLGAGACRQQAPVERSDAAATNEAARQADRTAELQRQREFELSKMDDRVAALERKYDEKLAASPRGTSGASASARLRDDVKSDMDDVKGAVEKLRTTTAENWWDRHEAAMRTAFDDVESDVKRFAGSRALPVQQKGGRVADAAGTPVSTAPFTSSRDKFVADMQARVDAMNKTLDNVKATGPRKTELNDLHARVNKLGEDIDRLKSASAEDWWDVSKSRVNDYIERVEKSVARLDDNKR